MGTMRPSWEIAPYFAFIDVHFVLSQASISLTIKQGHSNEGFFLDRLPEIKLPISIHGLSERRLQSARSCEIALSFQNAQAEARAPMKLPRLRTSSPRSRISKAYDNRKSLLKRRFVSMTTTGLLREAPSSRSAKI